jgi:hypothetical protein
MQETDVLGELTIKLLFFRAKTRKVFDCLIKHRDLNPIRSTLFCQKSSLMGFEISGLFLLRIDRAVSHNFSATPLDL